MTSKQSSSAARLAADDVNTGGHGTTSGHFRYKYVQGVLAKFDAEGNQISHLWLLSPDASSLDAGLALHANNAEQALPRVVSNANVAKQKLKNSDRGGLSSLFKTSGGLHSTSQIEGSTSQDVSHDSRSGSDHGRKLVWKSGTTATFDGLRKDAIPPLPEALYRKSRTPSYGNLPKQNPSDERSNNVKDPSVVFTPLEKEPTWRSTSFDDVKPEWTNKVEIEKSVDAHTKKLSARDWAAVEYSKNLLEEGDTLVYILYPYKAYNASGFCISNLIHRVHSEKLLATGSQRFRDLLNPTKQYRTLRRKHINLANKIPTGIKYVIDLTPADEGDDALELVTSLSCPFGVRQWYSAEQRLGVAHNLVGGEDDTVHFPISEVGSNSVPVETSLANDIPYNPAPKSDWDATFNKEDCDLAEGLRRSDKVVIGRARLPQHRVSWNFHDTADYCPLRHRAGIVRLLRAIEGKSSMLDSATKVWTLVALAQYYDCALSVVDWVSSWLLTDLNTRFVGVLPEAAWNIASVIQNATISRGAFSILVGEEALLSISRTEGRQLVPGRNRFGRRVENIGEDLKTRLEYASKSFIERIRDTFSNLLDPYCSWFEESAEYRKLETYGREIQSLAASDKRKKLLLSELDQFRDLLRHWTRGSIIGILLRSFMSSDILRKARSNRIAEDYASVPEADLGDIYAHLSPGEKVFTQFFWQMLSENYVCLDGNSQTNFPLFTASKSDTMDTFAAHGIQIIYWDHITIFCQAINAKMLDIFNQGLGNYVQPPVLDSSPETSRSYIPSLYSSTSPPSVSQVVSPCGSDRNCEMTLPQGYHETTNDDNDEGQDMFRMEQEFHGEGPSDEPLPHRLESQLQDFPVRQRCETWKPLLETSPELQKGSQADRRSMIATPTVYGPVKVKASSPIFDLRNFFIQVQSHIDQVTASVLSQDDIVKLDPGLDMQITNTLVCLGAEESKYLPLWAGGNDDGSGGVFNEEIPTAVAGPSGPGPSFHIGMSVSSDTNSESSYNSASQTVSYNTSIEVNDGRSDFFPRNRVVSNDDIWSESFSGDEAMWRDVVKGKGKGKEVLVADSEFHDDVVSMTASDCTIQEDEISYSEASGSQLGQSTRGDEVEERPDAEFITMPSWTSSEDAHMDDPQPEQDQEDFNDEFGQEDDDEDMEMFEEVRGF